MNGIGVRWIRADRHGAKALAEQAKQIAAPARVGNEVPDFGQWPIGHTSWEEDLTGLLTLAHSPRFQVKATLY